MIRARGLDGRSRGPRWVTMKDGYSIGYSILYRFSSMVLLKSCLRTHKGSYGISGTRLSGLSS